MQMKEKAEKITFLQCKVISYNYFDFETFKLTNFYTVGNHKSIE